MNHISLPLPKFAQDYDQDKNNNEKQASCSNQNPP